jgi:predicted Zn-dependent protease
LAVALVKQGDSARAMTLVTAILADDPQHAGARLLRGQSRMAAGDLKGAIDDFRAHTDANPQAVTVWAMLGEALAQLGDATASKAAFCRAADLGVERARSRCPRR